MLCGYLCMESAAVLVSPLLALSFCTACLPTGKVKLVHNSSFTPKSGSTNRIVYGAFTGDRCAEPHTHTHTTHARTRTRMQYTWPLLHYPWLYHRATCVHSGWDQQGRPSVSTMQPRAIHVRTTTAYTTFSSATTWT